MRTGLITIGAPGAGKSTWIRNHNLEQYIISPDMIRLQMQSPETSLSGEKLISVKNDGKVWELLFEILENRMKIGDFFIIDATHSSTSLINRYKRLAKKYRYRLNAIDFREIPLDQILIQNAKRLENPMEKHKYVPDDAIKRLYERSRDLIVSGINVIKYNDESALEELFNTKYKMDIDGIFSIGDLHGGYHEYMKLKEDYQKDFDNPRILKIFVGDYFDRFDLENDMDVIHLFKELHNVMKENRRDFLFLIGNHEWTTNIHISRFIDFKADQKYIHDAKIELIKSEPLLGLFKEWYSLESENIKSEKIKQDLEVLPESNEELITFKRFARKIKKLISFEKNYIEEYDKFKSVIAPGTRKTLHHLCSHIDHKDIKNFFMRLAQFAYLDLGEFDVFVNHGGTVKLPEITDSTKELVYGIGKYGEEEKVCEQFCRNNLEKKPCFQIFGHRDIYDLKDEVEKYNCAIINGNVDKGPKGTLKAFKITKDYTTEYIEFFSIRDEQKEYVRWENKKMEEKLMEDKEYLKEHGIIETADQHKGIIVKNTGLDDIYAINFTSRVFKSGDYDALSIHARGLFVQKGPDNTEVIIARGYHKFFNLNERESTQPRNLTEDKIKYPLAAIEKSNGYLGILSAYVDFDGNKKWFISSKTAPLGEYSDKFKEMITPFLNDKIMDYIIDNKITVLFEVIDPEFDPHIEAYNFKQIVLLDVVKNKLEFELDITSKLDLISTWDLVDKEFNFVDGLEPNVFMRLDKKSRFNLINSFKELNEFLDEQNSNELLSIDGIEGFVFKDSNGSSPFMFKLKTNWYKFWKKVRTLRDKAYKIYGLYDQGKKHMITEQCNLYKSKVYSYEEHLVWNWLVKKIKDKDEEFFKSQKSVPELRKIFLEEYKSPSIRKSIAPSNS